MKQVVVVHSSSLRNQKVNQRFGTEDNLTFNRFAIRVQDCKIAKFETIMERSLIILRMSAKRKEIRVRTTRYILQWKLLNVITDNDTIRFM